MLSICVNKWDTSRKGLKRPLANYDTETSILANNDPLHNSWAAVLKLFNFIQSIFFFNIKVLVTFSLLKSSIFHSTYDLHTNAAQQ